MQVSSAPPANPTLEQIISATSVLRRALASLEPGAHITLELIDSAFAAVCGVSETRRSELAGHRVPIADRPDSNQVLADYHSALREWERQLPRVQGWLLAEKARLQARSGHARSVSTWLETNQQTK